ncbi:chymotrypsin BI-like [Zophobas morio]|uniref:chymotrypsin BI-like n=1 Tax=Zophobas morio TaxID=2755281 RepID=UPI003082EBBE
MKRNQLIFLGVALIVYISQSEAATKGSRIIGGDVARAGQFPFAAAIHVQTADSKFFCGGALTGNDWVVTSGHCVNNAILFTIHIGSNHRESAEPDGLTVATSTYVLHPDFNADTFENDIGLIEFRRPIDFNSYLEPVYTPEFPLNDYADVIGLGWGQISDNDAELSDDLRYVKMTAITNTECKMTYGNQITDGMVCAIGNYNEGTCVGDTGSPLVIEFPKNYFLVGVASFLSANGCESTNPSGYTRTYYYFDWIKNVTGTYPGLS